MSDYISHLKIEKAKELLITTDDSLAVIVQKIGKIDVTNFTRTFKKETGLTPGAFRQKYKDTNKYILYFKSGTVQEIKKIGLGSKKNQAPQAPRYTIYKKIFTSKTIEDVWNN